MKNWYLNLNKSEQRLLLIGASLVALALLWVTVYQPVTRHLNTQASIKDRLANQLVQMQSLSGATSAAAITEVQPLPTGMTFSSWVDQQLKQVQLQDVVNRTEPTNANTLVVWMQAAPFDQVADWLHQISTQYAINVDQIDINTVDSALGLTNIRMRLIK